MSIRSLRSLVARACAAAFFASLVGASCGQTTLGIMPGVVNDPANLSLRKAILAFGTARMCGEAKKRSLGLRLREEDPIIGRFFPVSCASSDLMNRNLAVQFGGYGYVWSNLTQRVSFEAGGTIEYDTDFLMDGSTMYVYFRQRGATTAGFKTRVVEQLPAAIIGGFPIGGGGQSFADSFGQQIMQGEIARGFTVIRQAGGATEFGMGVIEPGKHPPSPFKVDDHGRDVLANERSEVHQNQRDFVGPLDVRAGSKLEVTVAVDGAPAIDVMVLPRGVAEPWLAAYTMQAATTPPPAMPIVDEPVYAGVAWRRKLSLPPGHYYLVLDNTPTAGRTAPATAARDDRAALVSYAVALE